MIRVLLITVLIAFHYLINLVPVSAESLSVSLRVGSTQVTFSGYASPGAYLAIKQGGIVIGSTTADVGGNFTKTIEVDNDGVTTFELYATDQENRATATVAYTLNISPGVSIAVTNIVMPPTVALISNPLYQGDTISLIGYTHPSATITILISNGSTQTVSAGPDGRWGFEFSMAGYTGLFSLSVASRMPGGHLSINSQSLSFNLLSKPTSSSEITSQSNTPIPSATPRVGLPPWLAVFDQDSDNRLSIDELYQIVSRWVTDWKQSFKGQSGSCDLNQDQVCNLTDFSILLYYIGN